MPKTISTRKFRNSVNVAALFISLGAAFAATAAPAAAQYRHQINNDLSKCTRGSGPAIMVTVDGVKSSVGKMRVQSYRATHDEWLQKGRWLNRIEIPARQGTMTFCLPVPGAGSYAVAIRHDVDNDNDTDLFGDGGGMSNNPSISIFNLGKPSYKKTAVTVGSDVKSIRIQMKYR